jgi:uncharacterized protein (DUF362 family)
MSFCSRRAALATAAGLLSSCTKQRPQAALRPVFIARETGYGPGLYDTVRRILVEHKVAVQGKRILLKPNLVEFDTATVINTNPVFVHAVMEACRALGAADVRIAEGPGHRRCTLDLADSAGYFTTVPKFDDAFVDLNTDDVELVYLPRPLSKLKSLYLPKSALAADLIISLPKMKTHHWVGATLSMKNFFGVVPGGVYGWPKNILHWAGIDECIVDLHTVLHRHFAIVDGIDAMEGNGPIQGTRKYAGVIVSGHDLIAVDATCCRIMCIDPARVKYLELAGGSRFLQRSIPMLGESIDTVRTSFRVVPQMQHILMPYYKG